MTLNVARSPDPRLWLNYDPDTGVFVWKAAFGKAKIGAVAGTPSAKGYLVIGVQGRRFLAHRLAWMFVFGAMPNGQLDHIDGNPANNRIANLREATNSQNHGNRGPSRASTSGVKGVYW